MVMRRFSPWLLAIVLSGCSALQGTPEAPPPATDHPQEIQRYQTAGLQKMATVSVLMYGSPMDVEAALKAKAEAAKAMTPWYPASGIRRRSSIVDNEAASLNLLYTALRPFTFSCA